MRARLSRNRCRLAAGAGYLAAAIVASGVAFGLASGTARAAAEIVPHEARYAVQITAMQMPGRAVEAGGSMEIRVAHSCDGWTYGNRVRVSIRMADGRGMVIDASSAMREALDAGSLDFEHRFALNGQVVNTARGKATMPTDGKPGRAVFTEPEQASIALPPATVTPLQGTRSTIEAFQSGRSINSYLQFEGQDPTGPNRITEVATSQPLSLDTPPQGDAALLDARSWHSVQSFFPAGRADTSAAATNDIQIHQNGVASRMRLDVGPMRIDAKLVEIHALPKEAC